MALLCLYQMLHFDYRAVGDQPNSGLETQLHPNLADQMKLLHQPSMEKEKKENESILTSVYIYIYIYKPKYSE